MKARAREKTLKKSRRLLFCALVCLPPAVALGACKGKEEPKPEQGGGKGGRRGGMGGGEGGVAFTVDILQIEAKKVDYVVTAPGTLDAFERVQVTARVAGAVDRVFFKEGQEVKAGETLVAIDSERFRLSVNSARAAVEKATAAQKDVEAQVARREGASEKNPGLIPGEELETFRTKVLTAKADTSVASENLKVAELNLRDSAVKAPLAGVIQTRTVETGQYVNTGYVMATLLQSDPMLLRFAVEPSEAPRIKPGMKVKFTMRETQRTFDAVISLVAASADATTHMVGVTAQVDKAEGHTYWLRPGSFCDVSIDVGATRDAALIPRIATRATDHGYVVFVANGDVVDERVITMGMNTKDGWVEVKTGIQPGEWLVVRGAEALTDNARIRGNKISSLDAGAPPVEDAMDRGDGGDPNSGPRGRGGGGRGGDGGRGPGGFGGDGGRHGGGAKPE